MRRTRALLSLLLIAWPSGCSAQRLGPDDVARLGYGGDPLQFGDLRLPKGAGPFPVAVVLHGGCWRTRLADVGSTAALAEALTRAGVATWNVEYRRIGDPGGGWPGTFLDAGAAVDHLRVLATSHPIDLDRVVLVGHSAGGHLALWAASRHRQPAGSPLRADDPLRVRGVVDLAGPGDLEAFYLEPAQGCGRGAVSELVGGSPSEVPERYRLGSPSALLPLGVRQVLVTGAEDGVVPPRLSSDYEAAARAKGDDVRLVIVERAGHFEVIAPGSIAWPAVETAVLSLIRPRPSTSSRP